MAGHSLDGCRMIKELIDADAIGDVKELTAWCSLTYYPYGHA